MVKAPAPASKERRNMVALPDLLLGELLHGSEQAACQPADAGSPLNQNRIEATFRAFGSF
jgi:hypothetical protein